MQGPRGRSHVGDGVTAQGIQGPTEHVCGAVFDTNGMAAIVRQPHHPHVDQAIFSVRTNPRDSHWGSKVADTGLLA